LLPLEAQTVERVRRPLQAQLAMDAVQRAAVARAQVAEQDAAVLQRVHGAPDVHDFVVAPQDLQGHAHRPLAERGLDRHRQLLDDERREARLLVRALRPLACELRLGRARRRRRAGQLLGHAHVARPRGDLRL
jgi:hypothetical protein